MHQNSRSELEGKLPKGGKEHTDRLVRDNNYILSSERICRVRESDECTYPPWIVGHCAVLVVRSHIGNERNNLLQALQDNVQELHVQLDPRTPPRSDWGRSEGQARQHFSSSFMITFLLLPSPITRRMLPQLKLSIRQKEYTGRKKLYTRYLKRSEIRVDSYQSQPAHDKM